MVTTNDLVRDGATVTLECIVCRRTVTLTGTAIVRRLGWGRTPVEVQRASRCQVCHAPAAFTAAWPDEWLLRERERVAQRIGPGWAQRWKHQGQEREGG